MGVAYMMLNPMWVLVMKTLSQMWDKDKIDTQCEGIGMMSVFVSQCVITYILERKVCAAVVKNNCQAP